MALRSKNKPKILCKMFMFIVFGLSHKYNIKVSTSQLFKSFLHISFGIFDKTFFFVTYKNEDFQVKWESYFNLLSFSLRDDVNYFDNKYKTIEHNLKYKCTNFNPLMH